MQDGAIVSAHDGFKHHLLIGTLPDLGKVFVTVEYSSDGKLSLTGVEGPKPNGDAKGSCGQIIIGFKEYDARGYLTLDEITPADGWTPESIRRLFDVWAAWHGNDMQAGCEHQRVIDTTRQVEVVSYKLTHNAMALRTNTRHAAAQAALKGESFNPTATARALAELNNWYSDIHTLPDADSPLFDCYEVSKRETKAVGWLTQDEHPDGMLSRPCGVCGYKYGSAWLKMDVPSDVVEWLCGLPTDDPLPSSWAKTQDVVNES